MSGIEDFKVVADEKLNDPASLDQGKLVVSISEDSLQALSRAVLDTLVGKLKTDLLNAAVDCGVLLSVDVSEHIGTEINRPAPTRRVTLTARTPILSRWGKLFNVNSAVTVDAKINAALASCCLVAAESGIVVHSLIDKRLDQRTYHGTVTDEAVLVTLVLIIVNSGENAND